MSTRKKIWSVLLIIVAAVTINSCAKPNDTPVNPPVPPPPPPANVLSYGDSILYLQNQAADYIVFPKTAQQGTYTGFPEGIELDPVTGAINISKSETGLRYRIVYHSPTGDSSVAYVVLSGITFTDHFYHLSAGDSIAPPVYNASISRTLPLSGSTFDEGNGANSGGCSVKTNNGKINLAETVRNGVFGNNPTNDVRKEFDIAYRINDGSSKSLNKLRVRLYYYATMADVAPDLLQTLSDRQTDGVFIGGNFLSPTGTGVFTSSAIAAKAKPRPPCVIIIAN